MESAGRRKGKYQRLWGEVEKTGNGEGRKKPSKEKHLASDSNSYKLQARTTAS